MTTDELNGLKRLIERMMGYYSIPGCAMAVIDGDDTYYLHFGLRDVEAGAAFDGNTVSGIGSCSKSMTACAALRLADKGVLDIDAPIASYVPGFALWDEHASAMVTLRDLLCHRTGVAGHDGAWPDNSISRTDFLRRLKYLEPNAPFRTVAQYSNTMYAAAGGVMEAVTGRKWEDILREEIFEPLGMTHTYCLMSDAEKETDLAVPYRWQEGLRRMARWNIDMAGPCGSVMSTAWDMAKWLAFHIRGGMAGDRALLTPSRFLDMHTPQILMDYPHVRGGRSLGYGLGWRVSSISPARGRVRCTSRISTPRTILSSSPCRAICWTPLQGGRWTTGTRSIRRKSGTMRRRICTTIWSMTTCPQRPFPARLPPIPQRTTLASTKIPATASSACGRRRAASCWTNGLWRGCPSLTSTTTPSAWKASRRTPTSTPCRSPSSPKRTARSAASP